ncbi:PQQ-dependent sugar dehydrogenase [Cellulomonas cellasea]|uniref:PQQ-dependent sugar dehydrogenase n=1 Tax=Cellulomonas cellasea TaxID=43670 RepID=UPI000690DC15|nr:PQQ-dependent sugar dehydrogenase [Cellulomonas cellasea]
MNGRTRSNGRGVDGAVALAVGALLLTGCSASGSGDDAATPGLSPASSAVPTAPAGTGAPLTEVPRVEVAGVDEVAAGLDVPWGLDFLPDGRALVTLRDAGRLVVVDPAGDVTDVVGPGAEAIAGATDAQGEGGLLGVAVLPAEDASDGAGAGPGAGTTVAVYLTAARDNRVLTAALDGTTLGEVTEVLTGIPKGQNHNGGRLEVGPDGFLYVTTGDTYDTQLAQERDSLGGKVLRITSEGEPAPGNPFPGSPVWTLGHRNVQGIGWAGDGRMFASEFGQETWDELNVLTPGSSYGWPVVEGPGGEDEGFVAPVATWATSDASPSGLAVTDEGVYLAGLRGERLWRVPLRADGVGEPQALLDGEHGRLRAVEVAPDGSLWVVTGNTDGRGRVRDGDDRILRVTVVPAA